MDESWKEYAADFNAMTDAEVEDERRAAQSLIDENERFTEAVAGWEAAGKPRAALQPEKAMNEHGKTWWEGYNAGHSDALQEAEAASTYVVDKWNGQGCDMIALGAYKVRSRILALIDAPKMP